jgi:hypothetical protein
LDLDNPTSQFEVVDDENQHEGSIRSMLIDKDLDVLYTGSFDKSIKVCWRKFVSCLDLVA